VVDWDATDLKMNQIGPWRALVDMASMLLFKSDLENVTDIHELNKGYHAIRERRTEEKCCDAIDGFVGDGMYAPCDKCMGQLQMMTHKQLAFHRIRRGDLTWNHCEVAHQLLQKRAAVKVMKDEKYCDCQPTKKQRIL
jgi:hypothetical protein